MNALNELLNHAGGLLLGLAGEILFQSSIVVLAVAVLDRLLRDRVRAVVRYYLWLLVPLKLLLPPSLSLPSSPAYWLGPATPPTIPRIAIERESASFPASPAEFYQAPKATLAQPSSPPSIKLNTAGWLVTLWAGVALALAGGVLRWHWVVRRLVGKSERAPEDLKKLLAAAAAQIGLHRRVGLRVTERVSGPALCGLFRPVILLPAQLLERLSESQLRAVLLHELAHCKRGDHWVSHAQSLLQIVFWWHPLVWMANARIQQVREEAVDETVLAVMAGEAEVYPETLVDIAKLMVRQRRLAPGLLGIMENGSTLGQRIRRMLSKPFPQTADMGGLAVFLLLATAVVLVPLARKRMEKSEGPNGPTSGPTPAALVMSHGKSAQEWFDQYDFRSSILVSNQVVAMQAFRDMGSNAVPFLREKLTGPTISKHFKRAGDDPRAKAAWILSHLGTKAEPATPDLIGALEVDEAVGRYAAMALGNIGPKAMAAVPALFKSLKFHNGQAAMALAMISPDHPDLVRALTRGLRSGSHTSEGQPRSFSAIALARLGQRASAAIPALQDALAEPEMRMFAARALRRIAPDRADVMAEVEDSLKPAAVPEIPPFSELLEMALHGDRNERATALSGLGRAVARARQDGTPVDESVIRDQVIPLLSEALDGDDQGLAATAATACGELGAAAGPLLVRLMEIAERGWPAGSNAIGSLSRLIPDDPRFGSILIHALDDVSPFIRQNAAAILGRLEGLGTQSREAVAKLKSLVNDDEPWVRFNASVALWKIDRLPPAVSILVERLNADEGEGYIPLVVCEIFKQMGPAGREGAPALRELFLHWNPRVREEARAALQKVIPDDPALKETRPSLNADLRQ